VQITWHIVAQSFVDQLSPQDRTVVQHAVRSMAEDWDRVDPARVYRMQSDGDPVFVLRAGRDFRVFLTRKGDELNVLDVVRRGQLENYEPRRAGVAR
jgi:hypothetical protein